MITYALVYALEAGMSVCAAAAMIFPIHVRLCFGLGGVAAVVFPTP